MEQDEFDLKIKQDFISEALEMLGWVEDQFLIFEQDPGNSKVVDEIFRMAHTVKGSAMTCGFTRLGEFAHVMEALLVKIREGKHQPDSESVDVLLRANDMLRMSVELLRKDFDAALDTEEMELELKAFIGNDPDTRSTAFAAFGFFDDDEVPVAPVPALSAIKPESSFVNDPLNKPDNPLAEASFLCLKAYLVLSKDQSPNGVKDCLGALEKALEQLTILRAA